MSLRAMQQEPEVPHSRRRPSRRWVTGGSIGMAMLAAIALAVTMLLAQRALTGASDLLVRGEAEALVESVKGDLRESADLEQGVTTALASRETAGVRYVAVWDHGALAHEAGTRQMQPEQDHPGALRRRGERVRIVGAFPPAAFERLGGGPRGRPPPPPFASADDGFPGPAPRDGIDDSDKSRHIVIEFEPRVGASLHGDLRLTLVVAGIASIALVAFALAWSRNLRKVERFEARAEQAKRLVALGQMSSVMAHELKNPLASLKGHAQLLAEQLDGDAKAKSKADLVVREAERLEALTKNLLEFVRDGAIDRRSISVEALIRDVLADLPTSVVDVDLSEAPPMLELDGARVARALHNLVENAVQATPEGKRVELRLTRHARDLTIEVRDHGAGIGSEPIFEPFVTTRVKGTGLGLPIARRVAEQHGGTLGGETHPDGGAIFRMQLPDVAREV
jgi:two-component system, NtrC family, sensor histidine kinase HydH